MAIKEARLMFPSVSAMPRFVSLNCSDTKAVVAGAGYVDDYVKIYAFPFYPTDFVFVSASDGNKIYYPVFSGTSITLTAV